MTGQNFTADNNLRSLNGLLRIASAALKFAFLRCFVMRANSGQKKQLKHKQINFLQNWLHQFFEFAYFSKSSDRLCLYVPGGKYIFTIPVLLYISILGVSPLLISLSVLD